MSGACFPVIGYQSEPGSLGSEPPQGPASPAADSAALLCLPSLRKLKSSGRGSGLGERAWLGALSPTACKTRPISGSQCSGSGDAPRMQSGQGLGNAVPWMWRKKAAEDLRLPLRPVQGLKASASSGSALSHITLYFLRKRAPKPFQPSTFDHSTTFSCLFHSHSWHPKEPGGREGRVVPRACQEGYGQGSREAGCFAGGGGRWSRWHSLLHPDCSLISTSH